MLQDRIALQPRLLPSLCLLVAVALTQAGWPARASAQLFCTQTEHTGELLLGQVVTSLSLENARLIDAVSSLRDVHHVPLSFIEASADIRISVNVRNSTVRQILELLIAQAQVYRYEIIKHHLIIFPLEGKYDLRVSGLSIGASSRLEIGRQLVTALRQRFSEFSDLGAPGVFGDPDSFIYTEPVSLDGGGRVVECLVQVLGHSPSSYLNILRQKWGAPALSLGSVTLVKALDLTVADAEQEDERQVIQLEVRGVLVNGSIRDLTESSCGTIYTVSDANVAVVSKEGLVTALSEGEAIVTARIGDVWSSTSIRVDARGNIFHKDL